MKGDWDPSPFMRMLTNRDGGPQCITDTISWSNESVIGICWRDSCASLRVRGYQRPDRGPNGKDGRRKAAAVISFVRKMQHLSVILGELVPRARANRSLPPPVLQVDSHPVLPDGSEELSHGRPDLHDAAGEL